MQPWTQHAESSPSCSSGAGTWGWTWHMPLESCIVRLSTCPKPCMPGWFIGPIWCQQAWLIGPIWCQQALWGAASAAPHKDFFSFRLPFKSKVCTIYESMLYVRKYGMHLLQLPLCFSLLISLHSAVDLLL